MSSTNKALGLRVRKQLIDLGIETPMSSNRGLTAQGKKLAQRNIENNVRAIMSQLGLNLQDDSLEETPKRVAKMFMHEIFGGLDYANFPKCTVIDNTMQRDEMVIERNIIVNSTCEHHLLPIIGHAHVAYIPNKKVLGLSKMNRLVDFFSRRPQVQERLVSQIHAAMCYILGTEDVAVIIAAEHLCVKTRGVMDACSDTVTSKLGGVFMQPEVRAEFISLIGLPTRG